VSSSRDREEPVIRTATAEDVYRRTGWSASGEVRDRGGHVAFRRPLA
jgi:hypothetical protein